MRQGGTQTYLRMVGSGSVLGNQARSSQTRKPSQAELFPLQHQDLVVFFSMGSIDGTKFRSVLAELRPQVILDLRPHPRFDLPGLSRQIAFSIFEQISCSYQDLAGLLRIGSMNDSRIQPGSVGDIIAAHLQRLPEKPGPMAILVEEYSMALAYSEVVPDRLPGKTGRRALCIS